MRNSFHIEKIFKHHNRISYQYTYTGPWSKLFENCPEFFVEYNFNIEAIPDSIAVIPLLVNLLPLSWIYDATITTATCDRAFLNNIPKFKQGYINMYPMLSFQGQLKTHPEANSYSSHGAAAFFSGGVDAYSTLLSHYDQRPALITVWGSDIALDDSQGWQNTYNGTKLAAQEFNLDNYTIKTSFRAFFNDQLANQAVQASQDSWWHGFQHGIGLIGLAAPIAYQAKLSTVYIASSFTAADKVTCASDPTIDNFVRFGNTQVVHDGYELNRQDKVRNIVKFTHQHPHHKIHLRVCWESKGGKNCCHCEKCRRTMLEIFAEQANPRDFGFPYTSSQLRRIKYSIPLVMKNPIFRPFYFQLQERLQANVPPSSLPKSLHWLYSVNLNQPRPYRLYHALRQAKNFPRRLIRKVRGN